MGLEAGSKKGWITKLVLALIVIVLIGAFAFWYAFTVTYADTAIVKADHTVNAIEFIEEFKQNDSAANKKYAEKIVAVKGRVSSIEPVDSTLNLKMANDDGSYVIFAFQQQDFEKVKQLKEGDIAWVKGSCNGGTYSEILDSRYITFKRCSINQ